MNVYIFAEDWHPAVVESIVEDRLKLIFIESLDNDGWSTYPAPTSTTPPREMAGKDVLNPYFWGGLPEG